MCNFDIYLLKTNLKDNAIRSKRLTAISNSNVLFGTRAHLLSLEEGSCCILSTRNNCCESLASYGVIFESDFQPNNETTESQAERILS